MSALSCKTNDARRDDRAASARSHRAPSRTRWAEVTPKSSSRTRPPLPLDTQKRSASNVTTLPSAFTRRRMRGELVRWLSREGCSHALSLVTNRSLTIPKLTTMFGDFCLELDRACFGKKNVGALPSADRLFAVAFIEHPNTNIHLHALLRLDGWWQTRSPVGVDDRIGLIWGSITGGAGSTVLRAIEDEGWGWYSTKEADVRNGDYLLSSDYHPRR